MNGLKAVCLLGFGEVGSRIADDLKPAGVAISAWDRAFVDAGSRASRNVSGRTHVRAAASASEAASGSELVVSAVTAAQDLAAARSVLPGLAAGAWFLDLNSVSPGTKQAVFEAVEAGGGRYVEAAVLSPIAPDGIASPLLMGGPHAKAFLPAARLLGFSAAEVCSSSVGMASATKMCRSVVIKGMEALLAESLLAARHYGVEDRVLATLGNLFPHDDWRELARYMISRSVEHGVRRAEEMEEVSKTIADAGIEPLMSRASVKRQSAAAGSASPEDTAVLERLLDTMLAGLSVPGGDA